MNKKITVLLLFVIIFSMPFLDFSCQETSKLDSSESPHLVRDGYAVSFGYTLGFPIAFARIYIKPLTLKNVYPFGFIDFLLLIAAFYIYTLLKKRNIKINPMILTGLKFLCVYAMLHFLYNAAYSAYYVYVAPEAWYKNQYMIGGRAVYAILFPLLYAAEKLNWNLTNSFLMNVRLNFTVASLIYFLIGMLAGKIKTFRRGSAK